MSPMYAAPVVFGWESSSAASHSSGAGSSFASGKKHVPCGGRRRLKPRLELYHDLLGQGLRDQLKIGCFERLPDVGRERERELRRQNQEEEEKQEEEQEEEEENQEVEREIPSFGRHTACDSAGSACQTSSSEQADYSDAFLVPAVRLSRPLEGQIGGVYRRVWNNLQGSRTTAGQLRRKSYLCAKARRAVAERWGAWAQPVRAESGQATAEPKVEVEGLEPKNQKRVKAERPDLDENTQTQRSTEPKRRQASAREILFFAVDTTQLPTFR